MTAVERLPSPEAHHDDVPLAAGGKWDPVCGMTVDAATAKHRAEHAGHTYYFCSSRCREKFEAAPACYLERVAPEPAGATPGGGLWTCPMHTEIRRPGPGSCPICGMALEPMSPAAGTGA